MSFCAPRIATPTTPFCEEINNAKLRVERPEGHAYRHSGSAAIRRDGLAKPSGASGRGAPARRGPRTNADKAARYRPLGAPPGAPLREAAGSPAKKARIAHVEQEEEVVEVLEEEVEVVEEAEVVKPGNKRKKPRGRCPRTPCLLCDSLRSPGAPRPRIAIWPSISPRDDNF
jgi:hypothetical protein